MLFRKLHIERTPDSKVPVIKWYMILQTFEDVIRYTEIDSDLTVRALFTLPDSITKSHLDGGRERVLATMLQCAAYKAKDGEKVYPIDVVGDLIRGKAKSMLSLISSGHEILVQQIGSYCPYDGYVDTWDARVIDEIIKDDLAFPIDEKPIVTDLLYIENGERVPVSLEHEVDRMLGVSWGSINGWETTRNLNQHRLSTNESVSLSGKPIKYKLTNLKLVDPLYIQAMISKARVIAFESQLADKMQIDDMLKLFSKLSRKKIIIKTPYKDELTSNQLFEACNQIHEIIFI